MSIVHSSYHLFVIGFVRLLANMALCAAEFMGVQMLDPP